MRLSRGFLSLGMRDVRSSPPPVPEDAGQRAINRAHADTQKKRKDAKAAKHTKLIFFSRKWPADDLPLAPLKALKASPGSSAHWVAEAQATIQRGAASARVDPKELAAQGGVAEAAPTRSDGAIVPFVAEALGASGAEATEAPAPMTAETVVSTVGVSVSAEATTTEAGAPETAEAVIAEAGAPKVTTAVVMAARPSVQEAEASAEPLAQGPSLLRESVREAEVYPISSNDTSRAQEVVGVEETDAV
ncbi:uncharacterized protein [Miscanthus floridulus]|uniref:uncharacterized protein n=1 Tax=Miscanthus floridulus TaxID=154761 RepID=UPI00345916C9